MLGSLKAAVVNSADSSLLGPLFTESAHRRLVRGDWAGARSQGRGKKGRNWSGRQEALPLGQLA